jgi:hypothetical protein
VRYLGYDHYSPFNVAEDMMVRLTYTLRVDVERGDSSISEGDLTYSGEVS